jgi:hypothetical protein
MARLGWTWRIEETLIGRRGGDLLTELGRRAFINRVTTAFISVRKEVDSIQGCEPPARPTI